MFPFNLLLYICRCFIFTFTHSQVYRLFTMSVAFFFLSVENTVRNCNCLIKIALLSSKITSNAKKNNGKKNIYKFSVICDRYRIELMFVCNLENFSSMFVCVCEYSIAAVLSACRVAQPKCCYLLQIHMLLIIIEIEMIFMCNVSHV